MNIQIVVLCGGSGTRLWPESTKNFPKQFIPIFNSKSLFDLTLERIKIIKKQSKPIFITNINHRFFVKQALENYNINGTILLEPESKNTAAAIYLAAKICSANDKLIIMPSDHLITDNHYIKKIIELTNIKNNENNWITLGIKPTKPSEAYGYIKVNRILNSTFLDVVEFVEKPNLSKAKTMLSNGNYFWNSGIFIAKSSLIINSVKKYANEIAEACDYAFQSRTFDDHSNEINFDINQFKKIPSDSIDFAVMEKEKNIKLYPLTCDWNDVGSWDAFSNIKEFNLNPKNIIEIESKNNFIRSRKKLVTTIGINDLIIIDTNNAILIAKKGETEKVKLIVEELLSKNMKEITNKTYDRRPWGTFEVLLDSHLSKIKKLNIYPHKRLSLQYHNFRSEHWLIIKGKALVYLDGKLIQLTSGMSIDIPLKSEHYIHNQTDEELIIIETQLGTYFGEDDIIRLDDPYKRENYDTKY